MKKILLGGILVLSMLWGYPANTAMSKPVKAKTQQVQIIKDGMYDNHSSFVDESKYSLEEILESVESVAHVVKYMVSYETLDGKIVAYTLDISTGGTAVVIEQKDGYAYLLTNYHVAYARQPEVKIDEPTKWVKIEKTVDQLFIEKKHAHGSYYINAQSVVGDKILDAAMLKVSDFGEFKKFPYKIGNSDDLRSGDFVWAVGNPIGLVDYVLSGNVSSLSYYNYTDWFMVGCDIQPGYSGGPVIAIRDGEYELVGLVNAIMVRDMPPGKLPDTLGSYGIAIKINPIMKMVNDYFDQEKIKLELEER